VSRSSLARLAELWSKTLPVDRFSADDDFFALGGRSLTAATLLARVNREFSTSVSLSQFFESPTLAHLAECVDRSTEPAPDQRPELVIPLQKGSPTERPLVLIHPYGGSPFSYLPLVQRLPRSTPVYGVMAVGIESDAAPLVSVHDMAEEYLDALSTRGLDRGILLGGWSLGAFVAFELAVRLDRRGTPPDALLLFDPHAPRNTPTEAPDRPLEMQIRRAYRIDVDDTRLASLDGPARYDYLLAAGIEQGRLPPDMTTAALVRRANVRHHNAVAFLDYRSDAVFEGPTHIFHVAGEGPLPPGDLVSYWRGRLADPPAFHGTAGTHGDFLREPAVVDLVVRVRRVLRELRTDSRSATMDS
jgi:thioesterase domain-containing protein